jgi:hypothetical protein
MVMMSSDHTQDLLSRAISPQALSPTISSVGFTEFTLDEHEAQAITEHPLLYFEDLLTIRVRHDSSSEFWRSRPVDKMFAYRLNTPSSASQGVFSLRIPPISNPYYLKKE